MISKKIRHDRILAVVRDHPIHSQQELSGLLGREGIAVTQSTMSRDIRDLGLIKVRGVYQTVPQGDGTPPEQYLRRALLQMVVRSGLSGNILMFKTPPGQAHSLGVVLDAIQWPEIMGTVAGDDTVFVLLRNPRLGPKVMRRIQRFMA